MNYYDILKYKMCNKICFSCNSSDIVYTVEDNFIDIVCKDCRCSYYESTEFPEHSNLTIDINDQYYLKIYMGNKLTLYENLLNYINKNTICLYRKICNLPVKLLSSLPIKLEHIEKYIILI